MSAHKSDNTDPSTSPQQIHKKTQACDACRLRKVKCNGAARCQQCSHLNLRCIYTAPKARARTTTKRGTLISRYKEQSQTSPTMTSISSPLSDRSQPHELQPSMEPQLPPEATPELSDDAICFNPRMTRLPSLVDAIPFTPLSENGVATNAISIDHDANFFFSFLEDYEKYVFPVNPIITVLEARQAIEEMPHSREASAFVYALVAVTTILTRNIGDVDCSTRSSVTYWTDQIILTKPPITSSTEVTARMIMTSDFLSISLMGLQKNETAFYYLREATTLVSMMRIDDPMTLARLPANERSRRQRLYWEMFVHERYYTISCYQNSVLRPLSSLPEQDLETPYHVQQGFTQIVRLFKIIDEDFITNWLESRTEGTASPSRLALQAWIEQKHREINEEPAGSDEMVSQLTVMQQADLVLTKHWLRTLVWQLALSNCLLGSSNSPINLTFPLGMSGSLRTLVTRIARRDIEVHGAGILVKFFEITDTIVSVILSQPLASMPELVQHIEDFVLLAKFLFSLSTFGALQRQILNDKLSALRRRFSAALHGGGGAMLDAGVVADGLQGFSQWLDQTSFDPEVAVDTTCGRQVTFLTEPT